MDSLTALDYAANGYSLLYENGLFKQKIIDGEQVELPDSWLGSGGAWLVPRPEKSITVRFGGRIEEKWENGELKIMNYDYDEVKAVPYDLLIPGTTTNAVNKICLWRSRPAYSSVMHYTSQSSYMKNLTKSNNAEVITQQLYPKDDYDAQKISEMIEKLGIK
jgi:starch phosphorylase